MSPSLGYELFAESLLFPRRETGWWTSSLCLRVGLYTPHQTGACQHSFPPSLLLRGALIGRPGFFVWLEPDFLPSSCFDSSCSRDSFAWRAWDWSLHRAVGSQTPPVCSLAPCERLSGDSQIGLACVLPAQGLWRCAAGCWAGRTFHQDRLHRAAGTHAEIPSEMSAETSLEMSWGMISGKPLGMTAETCARAPEGCGNRPASGSRGQTASGGEPPPALASPAPPRAIAARAPWSWT